MSATTTPGQSHHPRQLSLPDRLALYTIYLPLVLAKFLTHLVLRFPLPPSVALAKRHLVRSLARSAGPIPLHVKQCLARPTNDRVSAYCAQHGLPHSRLTLAATRASPESILHLVGPASDKVLLYFHGGGYVLPMSPGHTAYARGLAQLAGAQLALLEYGISPGVQYPGQLAQGAAALAHLLQTHAAHDIMVGGDSAGGNLALGLLAHLVRPCPDVEPVNFEGDKLRGVLAISARCENTCAAASFARNDAVDIVGFKSMQVFTANWRPRSEVWAAPVQGERGFWKGAPVSRVLLVAGGDEVYVDDICETGRRMDGVEVETVVCPGETHVQALLDFALGIDIDTSMKKVVEAWVGSL